MMRITTGTAKGTRLDAPEGLSTRPTAERTKQAIFNILQSEIEGRRVLDLFAGSGQLALEALSRGAVYAYLSDSSPDACRIIRGNIEKTRQQEKTHVACCDFRKTIRNLAGGEPFGLIFLDPPYQSRFLEEALTRIVSAGILADGGYIVCENERGDAVSAPGLVCFRDCRYGRAHITILTKEATPNESHDLGDL